MRRGSIAIFSVILAVLALGTAAAAQESEAPAPNDEYWEEFQWGPKQINAAEAWQISTGTGETIAVVDSGVDLEHPDLAAKIVGGATFAGCNDDGSANPNEPCGNGDWESNLAAGEEGDPHGTHVTGIAAAIKDNSEGIAGIAPDAEILAVKALGAEGGTFEEIAAGIRWSTANGADVINLSLGALPGVQAFEITGLIADARDAIAEATEAGVVVVAAAGNDYGSICGSPGFSPGALCVVSTDIRERRSIFSNFAVNEEMDVVAAPGGTAFLSCEEDVISTIPAGAEGVCSEDIVGTPNYDFFAGTSMASPHVAGAAAVLTAQGRTNVEAVEVLKSTARTPPANTRGTYTPEYGFGIIDLEAAIEGAGPDPEPSAPPPGAPGEPAPGLPDEGGEPGGGDSPDGEDPPADNPPPASSGPSDDVPCSSAIEGSKADENLAGSTGSERISGRGGADRLHGDAGDDCIRGGGGKDLVSGGADADELRGGRGKDRINGGGGDDTIHAARGARDRINCGAGEDTAIVNAEKDRVARNCETVKAR